MFDRTIRMLGNVSLALLVPCLVLALASFPTTVLADEPDPTQCADGQTYVQQEGGTAWGCCPNDQIVYENGIQKCRVQCNLASSFCLPLPSPLCILWPLCPAGNPWGCRCDHMHGNTSLPCICL